MQIIKNKGLEDSQFGNLKELEQIPKDIKGQLSDLLLAKETHGLVQVLEG